VRRTLYDATHELFPGAFRAFVEKEIAPFHDDWERAGIVDKALFRRAGAAGFLGIAAPQPLGGGERRTSASTPSCWRSSPPRVSASGIGMVLHNDVALPYFLTARRRAGRPGGCRGSVPGSSSRPSP